MAVRNRMQRVKYVSLIPIIKTVDVEVTKIDGDICVSPKIVQIPIFVWLGFAVCITRIGKLMEKYNA